MTYSDKVQWVIAAGTLASASGLWAIAGALLDDVPSVLCWLVSTCIMVLFIVALAISLFVPVT